MPDTPDDTSPRDPYDPTIEARASRLEADKRDVMVASRRAEVAEIKALLAATLPHLATKADLAELRAELRTQLAEKPSRTYLWAVLAALCTAYASGLALLALLN